MITQMVRNWGIARKQPTQGVEEALEPNKEEEDKDKEEVAVVVVAREVVAEVVAVAEVETTHGTHITKRTLLTRSRVFEILIPKIS